MFLSLLCISGMESVLVFWALSFEMISAFNYYSFNFRFHPRHDSGHMSAGCRRSVSCSIFYVGRKVGTNPQI